MSIIVSDLNFYSHIIKPWCTVWRSKGILLASTGSSRSYLGEVVLCEIGISIQTILCINPVEETVSDERRRVLDT